MLRRLLLTVYVFDFGWMPLVLLNVRFPEQPIDVQMVFLAIAFAPLVLTFFSRWLFTGRLP